MICALEAGRRGRRVVLLEHAERVGKKILISGGGRCNFTNIHTRAENFLSENPHFAKSALARFTPTDIIAMVERHGIRYHEKTLGQLFCDRSALDIVTMLERECAEARVTLITGTRILSVIHDAKFRVETPQTTFEAEAVVVATGGLSIPKMGATGSRLSPRGTVRPAHRRVQTSSGATRLQPGRPRPMVRPVGRLNRSHRKCRDTRRNAAAFAKRC